MPDRSFLRKRAQDYINRNRYNYDELIPDGAKSLFAFPKGFLINLRLAPGALKTLRLRRIKQLRSLLFRSPKVYEQKTFE
jgi:hypothetical protein